jgi:uncharacterized membrane protein
MGTLESQEVVEAFGNVVKCALARGKAEAMEELHEGKMLTVPLAEVTSYNMVMPMRSLSMPWKK